MNNFLNEYFWFNFELNIELNQILARFNVKMNNQNVSATPNANSTPLSFGLLLMLANYKNWGFPSNSKLKLKYICLLIQTVDLPQPVPDKSGSPTATKQMAWGGWLVPDRGSWRVPDSRGPTRGHICLGHLPWVDQVVLAGWRQYSTLALCSNCHTSWPGCGTCCPRQHLTLAHVPTLPCPLAHCTTQRGSKPANWFQGMSPIFELLVL